MTIPESYILLGSYVRQMRKAKGIGVRELGRMVGLSAQCISDCENGKRKTSQQVLSLIAPVLELDVSELVSRGGHIPDNVMEYIITHPSAGVLLQRFITYKLSERSLQLFVSHIDLLVDQARKKQGLVNEDEQDNDQVEEDYVDESGDYEDEDDET